MGVSGVGKTAVGQRLAQAMALDFIDADDFHPPANVQKMRSGVPLSDDDRWPWLDALNAHLKETTGCVLACSALKAVYRDRLCDGVADVQLVHLQADKQTILKRMQQREHFMPASLLDSQFATWEQPRDDPRVIRVDAFLPLDEVVAQALALLSR